MLEKWPPLNCLLVVLAKRNQQDLEIIHDFFLLLLLDKR